MVPDPVLEDWLKRIFQPQTELNKELNGVT